jgi:LSD1 subclass zinc finger protein
MSLFNFSAEFTIEQSCRLHLKLERDKIGIECANCQNTTHFWIKSRWSNECKKCNHPTSLKSGTIMQSSNLSF